MRPYLSLISTALLLAPASSPAAAQITHGPILGRPSAEAMAVWARTSEPTAFSVRFGTAPDALDQVAQGPVTKLEDDNSGVVEISGLTPETTYHYEVFVPGGGTSKKGTFRTLPKPEALIDPELNPRGLHNFTFEFACGNNQKPTGGGGPSLKAYDTLLRKHRDEVDFAILNGDWLYEEKRDYTVDEWVTQLGITSEDVPELVRTAPHLVAFWENYKLYLDRAPNLAEWHRHVPTFYTADDHELVNDIFGSGTTGFKNRRAVIRDPALQGWFDYLAWANPVEYPREAHFGKCVLEEGSDILTDASADFTTLPLDEMANLHVHWGGPNAAIMKPEPDVSEADPNFNVYEIAEVLGPNKLRIKPAAVANTTSSYSIGRRCYGKTRYANCEFYFIDTRTDRELHNTKTPAEPGRKMIGEHQEKWMLDNMRKSDADFFFVISSVNFMVPHVGTGGEVDRNAAEYGKDDAWTVFLDQRERLIDAWDALGKKVFVLTGDLHNSFSIKVTDNVWEFASGPHNSVNHAPQDDEGDRPANGPFQYGPRPCEIRWSSYALNDIPRLNRLFPHYCIVQVNNVFNNPKELGGTRRIAFPKTHVIFRFYDGLTGEFRYAETIHAE